MTGRLEFVILFVTVLQVVLGQRACEWKTCHECITDPNLCMWCSSENFEGNNRCRPATHKNKKWCGSENIQNPLSNMTVTRSRDFSSTVGDVVQIKPQRYHLDLRVGERQTFSFSYKAAQNFPVDIYFLMDASMTMKTFRNDLTKQSHDIFSTIESLTKNVYMGLGTFVDKNLVPFHYKITANESYSFHHHVDLTGNISAFDAVLNNLEFGSNVDNPESGLDGIAQAIACKKQIKWREQSRKIIVYASDAEYHSAGDGKAAGIVVPYDGNCYLDENGFYTKEKEMDYPSVGIINKMATREQIKILFLTMNVESTVYDGLKSAIADSEAKGYDQVKDISNVLKEIYESITQSISLKVNLTANENNYFDIKFEPDCGEFYSDSLACTVNIGEEKLFTASILLKKYFNKDKLVIGVKPGGLKEELALEVNVISSCDCARKADINSTKCNKAGNWSCGVCECPDASYGPTCGCSVDRNSSNCSPRGSELVCSDHGTCSSCGVCECANGYIGEYCQDQNNNCQRGSSSYLCSDHGNCFNGLCTCDVGWSGPACDCTESNKACIKEGKECNNRGHCKCGFCECSALSKWDARIQDNFCGYNPGYDYHNRQCRHLIPCVNCLHEAKECTDICGFDLIHLQSVPAVTNALNRHWNVCSNIRVDFGCYADFKYIYNDNHTMTLSVLDRNCSQSQIMIGVISLAVLLVVGVATLVAWKLLTDARDRQEYERFLKSAEGCDAADVNPTYVAPSTTYSNPAFQSHGSDLE